MENQTKQTMTYESRMALVAQNFSAKMSTLYQPHVRLRDNDAGGIYLQEIAEAINSRLPGDIPNNDSYIAALREIWQGVTAKHKSNYWFSLSDVISATNKVASKYNAIYGRQAKAFGGSFEAERQAKEAERKPETIEGWLEKLKMTDDLIKSGDLARPMGLRLRGIPCAALARLGYEGDTSLEGLPETPAEHLPDAPPECNANSTTSETVSSVTQVSQAAPAIAKPLMAQSESELNMRLLKAGMTEPKPLDKPEFDAVIEAGGDDLPDWGKPSAPSFDAL